MVPLFLEYRYMLFDEAMRHTTSHACDSVYNHTYLSREYTIMATSTAYQVTDLARSHRAVVEAGRSDAGALIRDKDGVLLLLQRAEDAEKQERLVGLLIAYAEASLQLELPVGERSPLAYRNLAWIVRLDDDDQREMLSELLDAVAIAAAGGSVRGVDDLLIDWKATAEVAADPALANELSEDIPEPLESPV